MTTTTTHYHRHVDDIAALAAELANSDDSTHYVWFDEGGLHVGTLLDYARAWEYAHYNGFYLSSEVRTWHASYEVKVTYDGTDDNDYMHYRLSANDETVYAVIDGRA